MNEKTIRDEIIDAIETGDDNQFDHLLNSHPELERFPDGRSRWLNYAADEGKLKIIKKLVERGVDINEKKALNDSPEGIIMTAASEGHLELTRWLLDNGAILNHTVDGVERCFALVSACDAGFLDVVKLLVERGAAVNSCWAGMTPLDHAYTYNQQAVVEYLRSVGAKTAEELGQG